MPHDIYHFFWTLIVAPRNSHSAHGSEAAARRDRYRPFVIRINFSVGRENSFCIPAIYTWKSDRSPLTVHIEARIQYASMPLFSKWLIECHPSDWFITFVLCDSFPSHRNIAIESRRKLPAYRYIAIARSDMNPSRRILNIAHSNNKSSWGAFNIAYVTNKSSCSIFNIE